MTMFRSTNTEFGSFIFYFFLVSTCQVNCSQIVEKFNIKCITCEAALSVTRYRLSLILFLFVCVCCVHAVGISDEQSTVCIIVRNNLITHRGL